MAMRTNSVRSIMTNNVDSFRGLNAESCRTKLNAEYGMTLSSDGQIPSVLKELFGNNLGSHFNGYSNNLSVEFRRAYASYAETDPKAPKLADIFSQVTQDAKDFIASIAENSLFQAFLKASDCKEPSKDFALIGVKTAAMLQAEREQAEKLMADLNRKIEELEKNGFLVLNSSLKQQAFKLADEAIAAKNKIEADNKVYSANIVEVGKIKKGIEDLEKKLEKASTEIAKETLTATIAEQRIDLGKLEEKIVLQGQSLIGLANRSKRYADMAMMRHAQLVNVITGLIESSETSAKLAEVAGLDAMQAVDALIKAINKTAPEVIDPRAVKLVEKGRCKDVQEAMQFLKDME